MISDMKTRLRKLYAEAAAEDPLAFADEMQPILARRRETESAMELACENLMKAAEAYETIITAVNAKIAPKPVPMAAPAALAPESTEQTSLFCDTVKRTGIGLATRYSQTIGAGKSANAILHPDGRMTILAGSALHTPLEGAANIASPSYRKEREILLNASKPCEDPFFRILVKNITVQSAASAATILHGSSRSANSWRAQEGTQAPKTRGFDDETRRHIRNWISQHVRGMVEEYADEFCNAEHRILFRAPHRKSKLANNDLCRFTLTASRLRRMVEADQRGSSSSCTGGSFTTCPWSRCCRLSATVKT